MSSLMHRCAPEGVVVELGRNLICRNLQVVLGNVYSIGPRASERIARNGLGVCAGQPNQAVCNCTGIHIFVNCGPDFGSQDCLKPGFVGVGDVNLEIEAAAANDCRVHGVQIVRCAEQYQAANIFRPIDLF